MAVVERLDCLPSEAEIGQLHGLADQLYRVTPTLQDIAMFVADIVENDRAALFVARTELIVGQLVCTVITEPGKRYGLIGGVVVDESMRGQGVARDLLAASYDFAREADCSAMELTTSRSGAQSLYVSEGFESVATTVMRRSL